MRQKNHTLSTDTHGPGLYDITTPVMNWCRDQGMEEGLLTLFIRHTSASLTIQENADPDVCLDLQDFFTRIAPYNGPYRHTAEGPDDMPAHIKTALTQVQLTIPFQHGRLALGTWQGIYLCEFRNHGGTRKLILTVIS